MEQLKSSLLENNTFIIEHLPFDNQRKVMKLKIFLNSNNYLKYEFNDNTLICRFITNDDYLIGKEINKIKTFIETTFSVSLGLNEKAKTNLDDVNNKSSNFKESYKLLSKLKSNHIFEDKNFKEYCNFCDKTLACQLRPYQYAASYYLTIGQGGFDFSVPGSGKTIISYATYNYLKSNDICNSVLIIGPINSFNAWLDEYETCFNQKPDFISLATFEKKDVISYLLSSQSNHSEITFINVDKAWRFKDSIISFLSNKKCLLIIDEAHKEKNPSAKITQAVLEITKYVKYRIILTGTPMPNGYEDLFSLMKIYEPYEKVLPYRYNDLKRMTKNGATEEEQAKIMNSIKPIYSRVSKAHLLNTKELLPPKFNYIECHLSDEQKEIYDFLQKLSFEIDNDFESAFNINLMKAILIRKMQVSSNPGLLSKSIINTIDEYKNEYIDEFDIEDSDSELLIKADNEIKKAIAESPIANLIYKFESNLLEIPKNNAAVELTNELVSKGQSVLIWDVFVQNMYVLKNLLEKKIHCDVEIINGLVNGEERQNAISRFKSGKSKILIANPATLAESISLHKICQHAIYVNRNFNAAQFIQSKDRIHRINMPKGLTANYYFLINKDTVDECVDERLELKETRMLKILDSEELLIGGSEMENTSFMSLDDIKASLKK